jgi:hypothetical protein
MAKPTPIEIFKMRAGRILLQLSLDASAMGDQLLKVGEKSLPEEALEKLMVEAEILAAPTINVEVAGEA